MKPFSDTFKLYAYKAQDRCDLSIRVHDELVISFRLTHNELKDLLEKSSRPEGIGLETRAGNYWYVTRKKSINGVRITAAIAGVDFNFRVSYNDWDTLKLTYEQQMSNPMPWDNK
jgi:hypothetical protein